MSRTRRVPVLRRMNGKPVVQRLPVRSDRLKSGEYAQVVVDARGRKAWVKKDPEVRALEVVRGTSRLRRVRLMATNIIESSARKGKGKHDGRFELDVTVVVPANKLAAFKRDFADDLAEAAADEMGIDLRVRWGHVTDEPAAQSMVGVEHVEVRAHGRVSPGLTGSVRSIARRKSIGMAGEPVERDDVQAERILRAVQRADGRWIDPVTKRFTLPPGLVR